MTLDLVVKGGQVWTPDGFVTTDVGVRNGQIDSLAESMDVGGDTDIVDASEKYVIPGLIDTHTHHRDPGFTHKEDLTTATQAAAAGGVTLSVGMPNVDPPTTTVERFRQVIEISRAKAVIDFNHNPSGSVPEEVPGLAREGCLAYKIFMVKDTGRAYPHMPGLGVHDHGHLFRCCEAVASTGLPLMVHPHDQALMDVIEQRKQSGNVHKRRLDSLRRSNTQGGTHYDAPPRPDCHGRRQGNRGAWRRPVRASPMTTFQ